MSAGIRSGVHWMRGETRLHRAPRRPCCSSVLAMPGTPSSSTWPPATRAVKRNRDRFLLAQHDFTDLGLHLLDGLLDGHGGFL